MSETILEHSSAPKQNAPAATEAIKEKQKLPSEIISTEQEIGNPVNPGFPIPVFVQVFTKSGGPLTKMISVQGGELVKDGSACRMVRGTVDTHDINSMANLASLLDGLGMNQAIALGTTHYGDFVGRDVVAEKLLGDNPKAIARTAVHFRFEPGAPALILFDRDSSDGELMSAARAEQILGQLIPDLPELAMLNTHSSGSYIYDDGGNEWSGEGNHHIYLVASDGADIPRFKVALEGRLWLAGYGRPFVTRSGVFIARTVFDMQVFAPERLVFEAGAKLASGLKQARPAPHFREGRMLDTTLLTCLTAEEVQQVGELKDECRRSVAEKLMVVRSAYQVQEVLKLTTTGITEEQARGVIERRQESQIADEDLLYFDHMDGEPISAGDARKRVDLDGKTLADPLEPDYSGSPGSIVKGKAKFYFNKGNAKIHSFAHGNQSYTFIGSIVDAQMTMEDECDLPHFAFYAYLPAHQYIHRPTRAFWPAASVDGSLPGKLDKLKPSLWLDRYRAVQQTTWHPDYGELISDVIVADGGFIPKPGALVYNRYRPSVIVPSNAIVSPWLNHLRRIYPDDADHLIKWFAHRIQRPGEKVNHALVLGGNQGVGKDTILEPVRRGVGPWNWADIDPKKLTGAFNPFVESVVLRINEARDLGDLDRCAFYDHCKTYIAAPPDVLMCNNKHVKEYPVFNVMGVVLTTNHKTAGIYLPMDDRRHYVAWSDVRKENFDEQYWRDLWHWLNNGGDAAVVGYLKSVNLEDFNPKAAPPKTEAFFAIVQGNINPEDLALAGLTVQADGTKYPAVTIDMLVNASGNANNDLFSLIREPKNRRRIPLMMERAGYENVRNPDAGDGLWKIEGRRQAVYGDVGMTIAQRLDCTRRLIYGRKKPEECMNQQRKM